jgi:DNA-binding MarR family transcriptional regulator
MQRSSFSPIVQSALQEVVQKCLCLQMRQSTRLLTQWYDACLQVSGLRLTQVSLLASIAQEQTVQLTHLAEVLMLDRTTLTRNLKPLEREKLVEVSPGADKRVRLISLTEQGYQRLTQALPYWRQAHEAVMARMGSSQWEALRTELHRLETQILSTEERCSLMSLGMDSMMASGSRISELEKTSDSLDTETSG